MEGKNEEEYCPIWDQYEKWYQAEADPHMREFYAHLADCQRCQNKLLEIKDNLAFELLKISDADLVQRMREQGETKE